MFDNLLKQLKELNGRKEIKVKVLIDDNGYYDRQCPTCHESFKVNFEDWGSIVKDEVVYCPICKASARSVEWNTEEQEEHLKNQAAKYIGEVINKAIDKDVSDFNRKQKPGFITMKLSYKAKSSILSISPTVAEELREYYSCGQCGCRYAYLGTACFCPACGRENVESNCREIIKNTEILIAKYESIKEGLSSQITKEETEKQLVHIVEDRYCRLVSVVQKYTEHLFDNYPNSSSISKRKNVFQNVRESSNKWKELTGTGYEDIMTEQLLGQMNEYFQGRHLLVHRGGIIDSEYLEKVPFSTYKLGQRIRVGKEELKSFVETCKSFIDKIEKQYKQL